jgi:LysR family hydrogen peroxide-inducible transcriptional activator
VILVAAPFELPESQSQILFSEEFYLLTPKNHPFTQKKPILASDVADSPMLMLGEGHCFRDQILAACPMNNPKLNNGNSLETLRFMVANGLGLTLIPAISVPYLVNDSLAAHRYLSCTYTSDCGGLAAAVSPSTGVACFN